MPSTETAQRPESAETASCVCADQPWMPVPEAAVKLGRSKEYIYAGLRDGRLPRVKFGRSVAILRAFVEGFVAEMRAGRPVNLDEYAAAWFEKAAKNAPPLSMAVFDPTTPGALIPGERGAA